MVVEAPKMKKEMSVQSLEDLPSSIKRFISIWAQRPKIERQHKPVAVRHTWIMVVYVYLPIYLLISPSINLSAKRLCGLIGILLPRLMRNLLSINLPWCWKLESSHATIANVSADPPIEGVFPVRDVKLIALQLDRWQLSFHIRGNVIRLWTQKWFEVYLRLQQNHL